MCSNSRVRWLVLTISFLLLGMLLANPAATAEGFEQGLMLCTHTLLPALFPFFVVCGFVTVNSSQKSGFVTALLLSWLGGYAVCAGLVRNLAAQKKLSPRRAQLLLLLGCCSGPGFVIGSVGGQLLGSVRVGCVLYGAQLAANLAAVMLLWPLSRRAPVQLREPAETGSSDTRTQASTGMIGNAVDSCLYVCGTVIFFRIVQTVLLRTVPVPEQFVPWISAGLEISSGCADFAQLGGQDALRGLCLCLSVLGLSVFLQVCSLVGTADFLGMLVLERALHIPLMQVIVYTAMRFLPGESTVFYSMAPRVLVMNRMAPDAAFAVFLFFCAVLYKVHKKIYNKIACG
nr:hypothetical protein [uncultured Gemmiger sp.]